MDYSYEKSFLRDVKKLPIHFKKKFDVELADFIIHLRLANGIESVKGLEKISGFKYKQFYRIEIIKDYRIGFEFVNEILYFKRMLHRKDIYNELPW